MTRSFPCVSSFLQHPTESGCGGEALGGHSAKLAQVPWAQVSWRHSPALPPSFCPFVLYEAPSQPRRDPFPIPVAACAALGVPGHPWLPGTGIHQLVPHSPSNRKHPPKSITQSFPCLLLPAASRGARDRGRGSQWPLSKAGPSPVATGQLEAQPSFAPLFLPPSPWILRHSFDPEGSFPSGCPWSARTPWLPRTGPRSTSLFLTAHPTAAGSASSRPAGPRPNP